MKIQVTQAHINEGERQQCYRCPIALAIKDAVPAGTYVEVFSYGVKVKGRRHSLPVEARQFISQFDNHGRWGVHPFEFELEGL